MSALAYNYSEPYKLPAGILAIAVHGAFFALLYFGVHLHNEPPQGMAVDIWSELPAQQPSTANLVQQTIPQPEVVPPPVAPPAPVAPPKLVEPLPPPKVDIALPEKQKPKVKPPEPVKPVDSKPVKPSKEVEPQVDQKALIAQAEQAEQARAQAAQAAASNRMVNEFVGRIEAKIKRNVVEPPDVQDTMQAEFDVTLILGGSVLTTRLTKPSGSTAYDEAVERAIKKAQPLPLPPDNSLFSQFRNLHLTIRPKKKE